MSKLWRATTYLQVLATPAMIYPFIRYWPVWLVDFNLGTVNPNKTEVATDRICSTKTAALHTTYHLALPFCLSVRLCCLSYHLCIYRSSSRIAQVFWKLALGEAWSSSFYSLRITLYRRYRVPCMILYSFSLATGEQQ